LNIRTFLDFNGLCPIFGSARERLLKMDQRFVERVERAFATGCERRESAAAD
jgi:hypothetical protein